MVIGFLAFAVGVVPLMLGSVWLMAAGMALIGAGYTAAIVAYFTEVQLATPSRMQGRTSTAADMLTQLPRVALTAGGAAALAVVGDRWIIAVAMALIVSAVVVAATVRAPVR